MGGVVRIARGDLAGLDSLSIDALALSLHNDIKQPSGVAGFVDWRLCGRLGRLLLKRKFFGALGETMLMSSLGRLGAERIFLFGLGDRRVLSEVELSVNALKMVTVLSGARATKVAIAGTPEAIAHFLDAAKNATPPFEELVLLDPDSSIVIGAKPIVEAAKRSGFTFA